MTQEASEDVPSLLGMDEQDQALQEVLNLGDENDWDTLFEAEFQAEPENVEGAAQQDLEQAMQGDGAMQEEVAEQPPEEIAAPAEGEAGDQRVEEDIEGDELGDDGGGEAAGEGPAAEEELETAAGPSARDEYEALRNQRIIASMTDAQLDRYESYRRSKLPTNKMKKLLVQLLGTAPTDRTLIAMCGIGKMFVGDLIELARHIAASEGHSGPLLPRHVHRAYQALDNEEGVPHPPGTKKRMFR